MTKKLIIGAIDHIDLPEYDISDVKAKVDTGADSSSIWASNIAIDQGDLVFNLFDKKSKHYSDKKLKFNKYKTTVVRNSFGVKEVRYKIKMKIKIGEKSSDIWFTLANRSKNNYSVLLGRNFLRGDYIVDISENYLHSNKNMNNKNKKVLILASVVDNDLRALIESIKKIINKNIDLQIGYYSDFIFHINGSIRVNRIAEKTPIEDYDLVYFKSHKRYSEIASSLALYLSNRETKFFDKELSEFLSYGKLSQYLKLSINNIPIPETYILSSKYTIENLNNIGKKIGWPLVIKDIEADRGKDNYLVDKIETAKKIISDYKDEKWLAIQKFIPNNGYYRVYIFGREAPLVVFREPHEHKNPLKKHLNNPSGSINAKKVDISEVPSIVLELAILASDALNRQVVGVDVISDSKTKKWYILEANSSPQLKSGSFIEEKSTSLAEYIENELSK